MTTCSMAVNVEQVVPGVTVFGAPHPGRSVAASSAAPAAAPIFNKSRRESLLKSMEEWTPCVGCIVSTKLRFLTLAAWVGVKSQKLILRTENALVAHSMSQYSMKTLLQIFARGAAATSDASCCTDPRCHSLLIPPKLTSRASHLRDPKLSGAPRCAERGKRQVI